MRAVATPLVPVLPRVGRRFHRATTSASASMRSMSVERLRNETCIHDEWLTDPDTPIQRVSGELI